MHLLIRFGHDGWLGQLARDVTFETVEHVARAAGIVMVRDYPDDARLVVGFDRRFLSDQFAREISRELASLGIGIWLISTPVSTPVLSFAIQQVGAIGGIMVTGGSNRADVSGLRLRIRDGGAPPHWMIDRILEVAGEASPVRRIGPTADVKQVEPVDDYVSALSSHLPLKTLRRSGITIAVDSMWGTGSGLIPRIVDGDGSRSVEIRTAHNPLFPELESPRPVAENLTRLSRLVRSGEADLGLALSADGCTLGLLDEHGTVIEPATLNAVIAWYLLHFERRAGSVARTIASSHGIDRIANAAGALVHEMPVGHAAMCETLREQSPMFLGDESGGIVLTDHLYERDAVLAGLTVASAVVRTGMSLSEIIEEVRSITGDRVLNRWATSLTDDQADIVRIRLARHEWPLEIAELPVNEMYMTDGVKFDLHDGNWLLIRHDEIDGELQIVAEASDPETSERLIQSGRQMMLL